MKYVIDIPKKWVEDLMSNGPKTGLGKAVCKGRPLVDELEEIKTEMEEVMDEYSDAFVTRGMMAVLDNHINKGVK